MEFFKSNKKNNKIFKKINYPKLVLVMIISFILLSISFYYIGGKNNTYNCIRVASIVSLLLGTGSILGDLIENRNRIFILDEDEIGFIEIHTEKVGGPFLRESEYKDILKKNGIEKVYKDNYLYEGVDKSTILSIISVKKKYNRIVLKARVISKEWKSADKITISRLYIVEKEKTKKIIIPNDFDNYDKLYENLITKKNKI